jgi:subtilisin family serine protease
VDFLAPDGSVTSVFAPFYGTSAAAPDAAAVAALVLQSDPALTPAQLTQVLEASAIPASGPAAALGAGLVQADTAVSIALGLAHPSG